VDRTQLFTDLSNLPIADFERLLFAVRSPGGLVPGPEAPQMNRVKALLDWAEGPSGRGIEEIQSCLNSLKSASLPPVFDFSDYLRFVCQDPRYQQVRNLYTETEVSIPLEAEIVEPQTASEAGIQTDKAKQPKVQPFPVLEGLQNYALGEHRQHLLLAGRPGSGKSTALKRLLLELADATPERPEVIPVYVQLKGDRLITDMIIAEFRRAKVRVTPEQIDEWLFNDLLLLLLDGVNEIPSKERRDEINTFREDNPTTPMIFTTRDLAVGGDLGVQKRLEMRPLNEPQMREFVNKYLTQRGLPNQADTLLRQLRDRLQEVAETPLLLKMLCDVFDTETRQIPQSKGKLFRLFDTKYEQFKGLVAVSEDFRRFKPELLQHLAFSMLCGDPAKPTEAWLTLDRTRAEKLLETFLTGRVEAPGQRAKEWLEDLIEHHLLQVAIDPREIEFHHQLFQEYYAAEYLLPLLPTLSDEQLKRDYLNLLKWTEAVVLILTLVDETQALRVVKLALDVDWMLGARLAGKVKSESQPAAVKLVKELDISTWSKIKLLGLSRSKEILVDLIESLKEPCLHEKVVTEALIDNPFTADHLPRIIELLENEADYVRDRISTVLSSLDPDLLIPQILCHLTSSDENLVFATVKTLGGLLHEEAATKLLPLLKHEDHRIRRGIAQSLRFQGARIAIPELIKLLEDSNEFVRLHAAKTLAFLGSNQGESILKDALKDASFFEKIEICDALKQLKILASLEVKTSRERSSKETSIMKELYDPSGERRKMSERLDGKDVTQVQPAILDGIRSSDLYVRWLALSAFYALKSLDAAYLFSSLLKLSVSLPMENGEAVLTAIKEVQVECKFYNYEIWQEAERIIQNAKLESQNREAPERAVVQQNFHGPVYGVAGTVAGNQIISPSTPSPPQPPVNPTE